MKPVLVGEQNPYGGDPYYALYPAPEGCSGHRLCCMILGMDRKAYLGAFDRVNLCSGDWSAREARFAVAELLQITGHGRFVLLGTKVCSAFGVKYAPLEGVVPLGRHQYTVLPHPSGRCRTWGMPGVIARAKAAVTALCPELAELIGTSELGEFE